MVVSGFVLNRLNVAITGMQRAAGVAYVPKWTEISVTVAIVAFGIFLFTLACKYLPIFHEEPLPATKPERTVAVGAVPEPAR